jgi:hypothetical protein
MLALCGPINLVKTAQPLASGPTFDLKPVDVLVSTSGPPHFLWAAVHFLMNVKLDRDQDGKSRAQAVARIPRSDRARKRRERWQASIPQLAAEKRNAPFSRRLWRSILNGTVPF